MKNRLSIISTFLWATTLSLVSVFQIFTYSNTPSERHLANSNDVQLAETENLFGQSKPNEVLQLDFTRFQVPREREVFTKQFITHCFNLILYPELYSSQLKNAEVAQEEHPKKSLLFPFHSFW